MRFSVLIALLIVAVLSVLVKAIPNPAGGDKKPKKGFEVIMIEGEDGESIVDENNNVTYKPAKVSKGRQ